MVGKKRKRRKKKQKLSREQLAERKLHRRFKININTMFKNCGFGQVATRNEHIEFNGRKSELDNIFIYRNILVIAEDTTHASGNIKPHLTEKANFYSHCRSDLDGFLQYLVKKFPEIKRKLAVEYQLDEVRIIFLYCSLNT